MDKQKLYELVTKNSTAKAILLSFAERERNTASTQVPRHRRMLKQRGLEISDTEYAKAWKELSRLGLGKLVYGRRGNPLRFEWEVPLKDIGAAAREGLQLAANAPPGLRISRSVAVSKLLEVAIRDDYSVEIVVPEDFSPEDAEKISAAVREVAQVA